MAAIQNIAAASGALGMAMDIDQRRQGAAARTAIGGAGAFAGRVLLVGLLTIHHRDYKGVPLDLSSCRQGAQ